MDENQYKEMVFEEHSKSKRVAYLLWLFFGWFGIHRLYAGKTGSGLAQLGLSLSVVGFVLVTFWWWLIDAFLIPDMVNEHNLKTLRLINGPDAPVDDRESEPPALTPADRKREAMLEDLRQTGYKRDRRDELTRLYR